MNIRFKPQGKPCIKILKFQCKNLIFYRVEAQS